ncbi:UDP-N-acetylglucosamine pyrophosphorylase [Pseudomassariella vexata]|uniref:UDP-N-acetylglucosamine diphosphorylase n=1 Tax=Pseudomassariella vexata TaxID=1141098 RepID=A0A1Y2D5J9_9PEZI|nr:UDP-N-acetylglucosamine pyrophosphorylase [Pseudomassariella vexata]ORY54578.1 UDP-N-acetylglucosamine pyrophosphorylase [Pseudomassariella vexata]
MAPNPFTAENVAAQKAKYAEAGQGQVHAFYDSLSDADKESLYLQLEGFDPKKINEYAEAALNPPKTDDKAASVEPLPESATASILDSKQEDLDRWYNYGLELIAQNKVAVVLMAGGQGTRLGSNAPKGCFDIGLPSGKSLFQIQAERILKVQELAQKKASSGSEVTTPWYVMTSGPTRGPTEKFFQAQSLGDLLPNETEQDRQKRGSYFGLKQENVIIFEQGVLPCISNEGKIMLESKGKVAVAPDGNGGIYKALREAEIVTAGGKTTTVLKDMASRGVEHIHAYCVDNCLAKVADPIFIGFSAEKKAQISTKVVRKRDSTESVGLILLKNGKPDVVEYSEIDQATAEAKDPKQPDVLKFRAANIVNHYYSFDFLNQSFELPHHVARKKIPCVDVETGNSVKPEKPNGIKLEQFVFDVFPQLALEQFACLEVKREDEFSPLKNKAPEEGLGEDNAKTSRRDIKFQGKKWLVEKAGATVKSEDGVEISPLTSYAGEGLDGYKGKEITENKI